MKKISLLVITMLVSICFIGAVNAEEKSLNSIAVLASEIGGTAKEIQVTDTGTKYNYYYKYVKLNETDFNNYVKQKYIMDNAGQGTTAYQNAKQKVESYEAAFKGQIPAVNSITELSAWTSNSDKVEINLTNLNYAQNAHNGYVFAVAATKTGDTNVYITRMIYESTSATTLGTIKYLDSDKVAINTDTNTNTNTSTDTVTEQNPETGISDYAIYLVPSALVAGSYLMLKRKSYA